MAEIENLDRLRAKLKTLADKAEKDNGTSVVVGFTQAYALYVHENLQAVHKTGQAKFLEQPARELQPEFGRILSAAYKAGKTIAQGLLLCGLRLQREAQLLCPVYTGALRASAFTRIEKDS